MLEVSFIFTQAWNQIWTMLEAGFIFIQAWNWRETMLSNRFQFYTKLKPSRSPEHVFTFLKCFQKISSFKFMMDNNSSQEKRHLFNKSGAGIMYRSHLNRWLFNFFYYLWSEFIFFLLEFKCLCNSNCFFKCRNKFSTVINLWGNQIIQV